MHVCVNMWEGWYDWVSPWAVFAIVKVLIWDFLPLSETPILWLTDAKNWLFGKDADVGKDWRWEGKGTTEDEMVGWHHWLNGHEFEQAPGVSDGQGRLACCSLWKESNMTEQLNWTELNPFLHGKTSCLGWTKWHMSSIYFVLALYIIA